MAVDTSISGFLGKTFRSIASLKVAIPLIVLLVIVTVIGSLFPKPDWFLTFWYLGLLGILGLSLLLITILHIPRILRHKGRNALIGVVTTHAGILVLIAGAMYGSIGSSRFSIRAIEQEMTIIPELPFVIRLEELLVEEYPPGVWDHVSPDMVPKKRQDSHLVLYKGGQAWFKGIASPGQPIVADGYRILPHLSDIGWYFELLVTDSLGREMTIPVKPWAPPLIQTAGREVMVHSLMGGETLSAQVFTIEDQQMVPLGIVSRDSELDLDGNRIALGAVKRYTGLSVYNRPHAWVLLLGCILMMTGLVWHFYFRHRGSGPADKWGGDEF